MEHLSSAFDELTVCRCDNKLILSVKGVMKILERGQRLRIDCDNTFNILNYCVLNSDERVLNRDDDDTKYSWAENQHSHCSHNCHNSCKAHDCSNITDNGEHTMIDIVYNHSEEKSKTPYQKAMDIITEKAKQVFSTISDNQWKQILDENGNLDEISLAIQMVRMLSGTNSDHIDTNNDININMNTRFQNLSNIKLRNLL